MRLLRNFNVLRLLLIAILSAMLTGCAAAQVPISNQTAVITAAPAVTDTPAPSTTIVPSATMFVSSSVIPTATLPVVAFYEPAGCLEPQTEAGEVRAVNGWLINERTLQMLEHARSIYGGPIDLADTAITQGSYHDNGSASFGTHLGGGAVDLSIFLPGTWTPDFGRLNRLVRALRVSGFAAWVRNIDELYPGSGYHIHAIAIGDPQLSPEAQDQLSSDYGYFHGMNGLPDNVEAERSAPDRAGGPLLCRWMLNMGYKDLRPDPIDRLTSGLPLNWHALLQSEAERLADQDPAVLAASLYVQPQNLDRALALDLWRAAGLLPADILPAGQLRTWLQASTEKEQFWSLFPSEAYEHRVFPAGAERGPDLLPGDLLMLHGQPERMRVVLEVASGGRVIVLMDQTGSSPDDVAVEWLTVEELAAQGMDVLRPLYIGLPVREVFSYIVQPGDTLPALANRFGMSVEQIIRQNHLLDPTHLQINAELELINNDLKP